MFLLKTKNYFAVDTLVSVDLLDSLVDFIVFDRMKRDFFLSPYMFSKDGGTLRVDRKQNYDLKVLLFVNVFCWSKFLISAVIFFFNNAQFSC